MNTDNIYNKVEKTESCWLWLGGKSKGYGMVRWQGKMQPVHRIVYKLERHDIPKELFCDHLCRNRACVNPDHIELVTNRANVLRGVGQGAINARKERCKYGHEFSGNNLYVMPNGWRKCRACDRRRTNKYRTNK